MVELVLVPVRPVDVSLSSSSLISSAARGCDDVYVADGYADDVDDDESSNSDVDSPRTCVIGRGGSVGERRRDDG